MRPDVVLYGEDNPSADTIAKCVTVDLRAKPDLLLICGTSLKVHGLKNLVRECAKSTHSKKSGTVIFVNRTPPAASVWRDFIDFWVNTDADDFVHEVRRRRPDVVTQQTSIVEVKTQKTAVQQVRAKAVTGKRLKQKTVSRSCEMSPGVRETPNASRVVPPSSRPRERPRKSLACAEYMQIETGAEAYLTPPPTRHKRSVNDCGHDCAAEPGQVRKRLKTSDFTIHEDDQDVTTGPGTLSGSDARVKHPKRMPFAVNPGPKLQKQTEVRKAVP